MEEMENMFRQNYWTRNKTFYFLNHKSPSSDGFSCMTTSNTVDSDRPCMFPFKYPRFSLVCITFFRNTLYFWSSSLIINTYVSLKTKPQVPPPSGVSIFRAWEPCHPLKFKNYFHSAFKLHSWGSLVVAYSSIIALIFRRTNSGKDDIFYNCTPADNIKEWCFTRLNNDSTRFRCKY